MSSVRPDPEPCREQDMGLFEITKRDGLARLGKLYTKHGILKTPAFLPVINPNIRTITPREMWDKYQVEGLITNSYIIWKSEKLRDTALASGVHALLDYPGVIVTDSGTFQSYIYGDVEVENGEIVSFQKDISVDIATMLDVFTRPDMSPEEWQNGVVTTAGRSEEAIMAAEGTLLNGPIQGGLDIDLRKESAKMMGEYPFCIHPIGGIVPLMEEHRYEELFQMICSIRRNIPPNRPVHMFGCGHPMLFPFAVALGIDLFDSASYVLFARDDRLLTPTGTVHLGKLKEWTHQTPSLFGITPEEVQDLEPDERCELLSRANLEVVLAELARCRQAVRDGKIWELAELRSHCNANLREAWNTLVSEQNIHENKHLIDSQHLQRSGGVRFFSDSTMLRPDFAHIRQTLIQRWKPPPTAGWNGMGKQRSIAIFYMADSPWRMSIGEQVKRLVMFEPDTIPIIATPIGLLPYSLEDINPYAHLANMKMDLRHISEGFIEDELKKLGLTNLPWRMISKNSDLQEIDEEKHLKKVEEWMHKWSVVDKMALFVNVDHMHTWAAIEDGKMIMSRTGRVKNILANDGTHIASNRLVDGGISLTLDGAKWIDSIPESTAEQLSGISRVIVDDDAEPYVRQGKSVFHGFCLSADTSLRPGQPCLIMNKSGEMIGHGISQVDSEEMMAFRKGIAIRVRNGVKDE